MILGSSSIIPSTADMGIYRVSQKNGASENALFKLINAQYLPQILTRSSRLLNKL